ncbi:MAG: hypothetical protein WB689_15470 [Xanthobacteraceae bacterium]
MYTRDDFNCALRHPVKTLEHQILKKLANWLDDEDVRSEFLSMIVDSYPVCIEAILVLLICIYHMRAELSVWETEQWRPSLSDKQNARLALKMWAEHFADDNAVMDFIDHIRRNGVDEEFIDPFYELIDAMCDLRDEFTALAETSANETSRLTH